VPIPPAVMRASYALKRVGGSVFLAESEFSVSPDDSECSDCQKGFHLEASVYKRIHPNVKSSAPRSRTGKRS